MQTQPQHQQHLLQQKRTILGLIPAIDKRLYRLAKGVMPPISKTEQIALGCGTIGKLRKNELENRRSCLSAMHSGLSICDKSAPVLTKLVFVSQDLTETSSPAVLL
jgi:hypothetical protein